MTPTRRRVLAIAAAALCASGAAAETVWQGRALGAEALIRLRGDPARARPALAAAQDTIRRMERLFSLHDPRSALVRLNAAGALDPAPPEFLRLLALAGALHRATGGLFDPSVQPLWRALAEGTDPAPARALVGWDGVQVRGAAVTLARPGMALTLNGIAQGFATDRVAETLAAHGFADTLVDLGELRAGAGAWQVGIAELSGRVSPLPLREGAIATSSPRATLIRGRIPHILDPSGETAPAPWDTVSVMAAEAALADGLSTALCLAPAARVPALVAAAGARAARLVAPEGTVTAL